MIEAQETDGGTGGSGAGDDFATALLEMLVPFVAARVEERRELAAGWI